MRATVRLRWCIASNLDEATRAAMEAHARQYPDAIEKHHRLYPQVLDRPLIQAARVEAALTRSQPCKV